MIIWAVCNILLDYRKILTDTNVDSIIIFIEYKLKYPPTNFHIILVN